MHAYFGVIGLEGMYRRLLSILIVALIGLNFSHLQASGEGMFRCDLGLQGGCGYYVGDANDHIFINSREAYGAFFRYRFTQRWALTVQGMTQRIVGPMGDGTGFAVKGGDKWSNQLVNLDVVAEYNFFRFDQSQYDARVKTYTPYIGVGVGMSVHSSFTKVTAYLPFVVGFKWKFVPRCNLHLSWQHNVYFGDNLEHQLEYDNMHDLNGSNILNCDVTGMLVLGLSVSFAADKKVCRMCKPD